MDYLSGIWYSIFHSITAFCNTSFDLFGNNSLTRFQNDIYINIIFIALIILGGIGFFVLEDFIYCSKRRKLRNLQFQSKLVISSTLILLVISTISIFISEKGYNLTESAFLSTTLRTAGFYTTNIQDCNNLTKMICLILMFIGGAPGSTSGGIRIVTFDILILTMIETIKNRKDVVVFYRKINFDLIRKAVTICMLSILAIFIAVMLILNSNDLGIMNTVFHCVSAFSATGLGTIESSALNVTGKIIIMLLMFLGRIGLIPAVSLFILDKKENKNIEYVEGDLTL